MVLVMEGVPECDVRECAPVGHQELIWMRCYLTFLLEHAPVLLFPLPPLWTEVHGRVPHSLHLKYFCDVLVALPPLWMGEFHIDISGQDWVHPVRAIT